MKAFLQKFFLIFSFGLCFSGCLSSLPKKSSAVFLSIKTESIKFSDAAFIAKSKDAFILNGYYAGKPILNIDFERLVCLDKICMNKGEFNARYLHYSYYDNFLLDLINAQKLSLNNLKTQDLKNGFEQTNDDITYKVNDKKIYFKDKKNKILVQIILQ